MTRKTISMPEAMADWIESRVARGQYNNESEYFRDLVRRDQDYEAKVAALNAALDESERQIERGQYYVLKNRQEIEAFIEGLSDREPRATKKKSRQK